MLLQLRTQIVILCMNDEGSLGGKHAFATTPLPSEAFGMRGNRSIVATESLLKR